MVRDGAVEHGMAFMLLELGVIGIVGLNFNMLSFEIEGEVCTLTMDFSVAGFDTPVAGCAGDGRHQVRCYLRALVFELLVREFRLVRFFE